VRIGAEELIEEQQRTGVLRANGLEPRHRVLLLGPPGNGKTSEIPPRAKQVSATSTVGSRRHGSSGSTTPPATR
jgi:SpoVK/Ycf46/Vps4 family AAA+-type ATPase